MDGPYGFDAQATDGQKQIEKLKVRSTSELDLDLPHLARELSPITVPKFAPTVRGKIYVFTLSGVFQATDMATLRFQFGTPARQQEVVFESVPIPAVENVPGIEKPLDRKNARAVVEAFVAAILASDSERAKALTRDHPPFDIEALSDDLNVAWLHIQSVYLNDISKPTRALATSEAVRLEGLKPSKHGQRYGFLVFTLGMSNDGWFVSDFNFESDETADRELNAFLDAHPRSIGSPPLTDNGASGSGIDWSGYARGPHAVRIIERLKPVWSDAKHGIEFGVSHTTDQRKFHPGERVPLAMFVRNTGDAPLKVSLTADFYWNVLELQDARGVSIPVERAELQELNHVYCETLKPGEAIGFLHQGLGLHDGKPRPVPFSLRGHRLEETPPYWKVPVAGAYKLRQTKEITIEGLKDTVTFRGPLTSGTVDFEVIESAPDAEKVSGIAKPLDPAL